VIPARLSFVTLGARDVATLRRFYEGWGWKASDSATDEYASFQLGSTRLAVYPIGMLGEEAAPGCDAVPAGAWNGVTLALNVDRREEVDGVFAEAVELGAVVVSEPVDRSWGGRSAYIADPEGNRWEIAWGPGWSWPFES
jgi:uncharacterized protein